MRRAPLTLIALSATAGLALAACGGSSGGGSSAGASKTQTVNVTITPDGCQPDKASIPAGPTTFKVRNNGADAVSETELLSGSTILGEKENLAPGLSGSFSLNVKEGKYQLYCPDAKTEKTDFVVTAAPAGVAAGTNAAAGAELSAATAGYATYVKEQVAQLVTGTEAFTAAVKAGDIAKAKSLYGAPRANYERIEPVAESFGDLDPDIDARIDDVDNPAQWTGFHRIEKSLYADNTTKGMGPIADKLLADTKKLQGLVATLTYQPAQLANGATELLNEVGKTKITGEEERYSHLDLLDIQGNVDGADKAFTLLAPALTKLDPTLATTVRSRFTSLDAVIATHKRGDGFVSYDKVTDSQRKELSQSVDALAEPLSQVAGVVVG